MKYLEDTSSRCPRCGHDAFREEARGTLGYWAGRRIGPVECARCGHGMGYGVLESLPAFDAPTGEAAGSKYYQEGHVEGRSGTFVGKAYSLHPRETAARVEPETYRILRGSGERHPGLRLPRLGLSREWLILGLAAVSVAVVFALINASV